MAASAEAVVAAQTDARVASLRLESLERELGVRESEVQKLMQEVGRFSEEDRWAAAADSKTAHADIAGDATAERTVEDALLQLEAEERKLAARLERSGHREMFESFMRRRQELATEEARLTQALEEHEDTLAQIRDRLANPPASFLPDDPVKAQLYISWKKALAEKEEILRAARARRHESMADLKARHENQIIVLENERREAVGALAETVDQERAKVAQYTEQLAALDAEIAESKTALARFRAEFEQLRVALLVDRMAKSTVVAGLADRRRRLASEVENFESAVAEARRRTAAEEHRKWEARIAAEREAGETRIAAERAAIDEKIERVKASLAQQYEDGFQPLLQEAEARHMQELQRVVELQRTLEEKEAELQAAHSAARVAALDATGADGDVLEEEVPTSTLREFEDLRAGVVALWEQLDIPPDDVMAFLSECDLLAPYHPKVLDLYQTMHKELTGRTAPDGEEDPTLSALAMAPMMASPIKQPSVVSPPPRPVADVPPRAAASPPPARTPASRSRKAATNGSAASHHSSGESPRTRAALYDTYKSDVTSRLYPKASANARVKALRAKAQRSTRSDWGSGPGKTATRTAAAAAAASKTRTRRRGSPTRERR